METLKVPVVSITELYAPATLAAIDRACREWRLFQVVDHGIERSLILRVKREMRRFFARPAAEKRAILRTAANPWGYFDRELTKNTRDWKQVFDYGPAGPGGVYPQWPANDLRFRRAVLDYYAACERLGFRLLGAIALNLGLHGSALHGLFRPRHSCFIRLNYYPACPGLEPTGRVPFGVNQHTDSGALTLLLQDHQPGLEVERGGRWYRVPVREDALVINLGDMVQVWSNDHYRAALHRVVTHPDADRFSIPFFFNPDYDSCHAPLASMVDASNPPRYRPINWREFRERRAAGDYADLGEEVQISHYRCGAAEGSGAATPMLTAQEV